MPTLRAHILELSGPALAQGLVLIARRTAQLVPASRAAAELELLERALRSDESSGALEPLLAAGLARVCAALGITTDDTDFALDGSAARGADAIAWALFRFALLGDSLDAEVAAEGYEDLAVTLGAPRALVQQEVGGQLAALQARIADC